MHTFSSFWKVGQAALNVAVNGMDRHDHSGQTKLTLTSNALWCSYLVRGCPQNEIWETRQKASMIVSFLYKAICLKETCYFVKVLIFCCLEKIPKLRGDHFKQEHPIMHSLEGGVHYIPAGISGRLVQNRGWWLCSSAKVFSLVLFFNNDTHYKFMMGDSEVEENDFFFSMQTGQRKQNIQGINVNGKLWQTKDE